MAADLSRKEKEVWQTFIPAQQCMMFIGLSLNDNQNPFLSRFLKIISFCSYITMYSALLAHLVFVTLDRSSTSAVAEYAACVHIIGYGFMGKKIHIILNKYS